jgi:hypothetical protein
MTLATLTELAYSARTNELQNLNNLSPILFRKKNVFAFSNAEI